MNNPISLKKVTRKYKTKVTGVLTLKAKKNLFTRNQNPFILVINKSSSFVGVKKNVSYVRKFQNIETSHWVMTKHVRIVVL